MATLPEGQTYTVPEAAALLRVPTSTLYQHAREGKAAHLRPIRIGRSTRFPKAHIDRLLEEGAA